jgi:hypothetical protein
MRCPENTPHLTNDFASEIGDELDIFNPVNLKQRGGDRIASSLCFFSILLVEPLREDDFT